jgi:hypothetical protein
MNAVWAAHFLAAARNRHRRLSQGFRLMTKDQRVSRMTAGDVKVGDYFSAIDQGLALWLATEKQQTPRADRYKALCTGSCEALEVAIEVLRFFARNRRLVSVRITSKMLADVPHGRLTPAQVFYRWDARIGPGAVDPLHGAPVIGGRTFAVRPVMTWGKPGERFVHVDVAHQRRKGGIFETVTYDVDEVVDITFPITPNHPTQLSVAAKHVLRIAVREKPRLARILTTLFEEFEVELRNMLLWSRRRRVVSRSTLTLFLARETGVEEVLVMAVPGGGVALGTRPPDDPDVEVEVQTPVHIGRAVYNDMVLSNEEDHAAAVQGLYDLLDSRPSEEDADVLYESSVPLREQADRAIEAAASELTNLGVIERTWLAREREAVQAATQERLFSPAGIEITVDLAQRHVHAGPETTEITGRLAMRAASVAAPSTVQREASDAIRQLVDSLPRFYGMPVLHAELNERLTLLQRVLELYKSRVAPS